MTQTNQKAAKALAAELLALAPPERFELVAALLRQERPDLLALGWKIAERTVQEFGAIQALRMMREPSAERGLARMRGHLSGGGS